MKEISYLLGCSPNKVVYWMRKYKIKRRSRSEAAYIKHNPKGNPFLIKSDLSSDEKLLYGLGIGIYWGEGNKKSRYASAVANTDPNILKIFTRFLLEICRLQTDKLRYSIVCFNDTDPEEARIYWAKKLEISPKKFGKIVQIPSQGKGTYKKKSQFGVCTISVSNTKLKAWMMEQIENTSHAWIV